MEELLYSDPGAVRGLYERFRDGKIKTIVTDVTMVAAGIRKGALERLGVEVKCFLNDEQVVETARERNITRAEAGIGRAVEVDPNALYVFGNAPTALIELCRLIRKGGAAPAGIVAAPVGFVNVREAKYRVKTFAHIPKLIVEGRKGGSNLAATLVNAILTFDDAESLQPGRDV
jgi:precorrin isomerase